MCTLMAGGRNVSVGFISVQLKVTVAGDSAAEGGASGPVSCPSLTLWRGLVLTSEPSKAHMLVSI